MKYLLNKRVIYRSNEDEDYMIGELIGFSDISSTSLIPIIQSEKDGIKYTCMGITIKYTDEIVRILDKLTPKEQWELMAAVRTVSYKKYW